MDESEVRRIVDANIRQMRWALQLQDWDIGFEYKYLNEDFKGECVPDPRYRHVVHRGLSDRALKAHPDDLGMLVMGMERVEKLCGWAMDRIGPDGELRNLDPDGSSALGEDYQDIRDEVASMELGLIKVGLGENGKES